MAWFRDLFPYESRLRAIERTLVTIYVRQEKIMADIDDAAAASKTRAEAILAKVGEVVTTLHELKDLIATGNTVNAVAILGEANTILDTALANLAAAENETDPTPDA
jgi:tRNA A-37 threonylcarbamoyl transferase component Bud32